MNVQPTGNGRRESYASLPLPRMTNTYMLGGHCDPAEILASLKKVFMLLILVEGKSILQVESLFLQLQKPIGLRMAKFNILLKVPRLLVTALSLSSKSA
jgi:hypothetical protein